jgi:hypothetical protein
MESLKVTSGRIQNDKGGHAICNAGIIDLGNKTLVFDAFINPDAAIELRLRLDFKNRKRHQGIFLRMFFKSLYETKEREQTKEKSESRSSRVPITRERKQD